MVCLNCFYFSSTAGGMTSGGEGNGTEITPGGCQKRPENVTYGAELKAELAELEAGAACRSSRFDLGADQHAYALSWLGKSSMAIMGD